MSTDNDVSTVSVPLNMRLSTHCLCICVHLACGHNHVQTVDSPHSASHLIAPLGHHRACITVLPGHHSTLSHHGGVVPVE